MNMPHQLNEPLTYMPIPDSPYGWQEKMFSINSLEQNFAAYTGSDIRDWMEFSCGPITTSCRNSKAYRS